MTLISSLRWKSHILTIWNFTSPLFLTDNQILPGTSERVLRWQCFLFGPLILRPFLHTADWWLCCWDLSSTGCSGSLHLSSAFRNVLAYEHYFISSFCNYMPNDDHFSSLCSSCFFFFLISFLHLIGMAFLLHISTSIHLETI